MFNLSSASTSTLIPQGTTVNLPLAYCQRAEVVSVSPGADFYLGGYAVRYHQELTDEEIIQANGFAGGFDWLDDAIEDGY